MRKLCKAAKMGKLYAMHQLGICYQLGRECRQDMNEAAALISGAAEAGCAPAIEWVKDYTLCDETKECPTTKPLLTLRYTHRKTDKF